MSGASIPLTPGTRLGVYGVTAKLGAGGVGEVWRATDERVLVATRIAESGSARLTVLVNWFESRGAR